MDLATLLIIAAAAAFLLDSLIGDPYWAPHPIRLFGNSVSVMERAMNRGGARRLNGGVAWVILVGGSYAVFRFMSDFLSQYPIAWTIFTALVIFWGLSSRCLIDEGLKVERILRHGDVEGARRQLSMIVGRDTSQLSPAQIRAAVIETLAENLSDGTIAPLFFFVLGGAPLMMCYKMVNTLDSMVGYKNDKYLQFGCVSARMDDVANFIPARITALLIALVSFSARSLRFVAKYGRSHSSPNAGYPESAIAGVLDCRLGGPNVYFGKVVQKPYIGHNDRELTHSDLVGCCFANGKVTILAYAIVLSILILL
ncbi:MAG: adenosylcobinamide-phosphate synthase CbiB [Rikenellaceae bacterium]